VADIEAKRLLHSLVMIQCEKWTYDAPASDWLVANGLATQQDFEDKTTEFELTSMGGKIMSELEGYLNVVDYSKFCETKKPSVLEFGFDTDDICPTLFPFQRDIVKTSLKRGRSAIFAERGLGKTPMQLSWAQAVCRNTDGKVLILAPLAVSQQTIREGEKFGIPVKYATTQSDCSDTITITNYERLANFEPSEFSGVVLDESSILKAYTGKTKRELVRAFKATQFKLACSATPSPNDHMELGNHSEFLGIMESNEMLARWFIVDTQLQAGNYRLKGHASRDFWDWVSSWAMMASKPSDVSPEYDDSTFVLPEMSIIKHCIGVDIVEGRGDGMLLRIPEMSATSVHRERRISSNQRAKEAAALIKAEPNEPWLIWADTDYEAEAVVKELDGVCNVKGSSSLEHKEEKLIGFSQGDPLWLLTKPKIAGFGMNWQHCARVLFVASTFSFESWYQAIGRCHRFGQTRPVHVHMVFGHTEAEVMNILERKRQEFGTMQKSMFAAARRRQHDKRDVGDYNPTIDMLIPSWLTSQKTEGQ